MKEQIPGREISREEPFALCFVCLGNVCRSPTAEGIMQHLVEKEGVEEYFKIDSAGTAAYHIGEPANSKSQMIANQHGITLHSRGRRFEVDDLSCFDLILAMDRENLANIQALDTDHRHEDKVMLLRDFDLQGRGEEVPDPYFGGINGFKTVFDVIYRSCSHLLNILTPNIKQQ